MFRQGLADWHQLGHLAAFSWRLVRRVWTNFIYMHGTLVRMAGRGVSAGFLSISKASLCDLSSRVIGLLIWHIGAPRDNVILKTRLRNNIVSLLTQSEDQSRPALIQGKRKQTLLLREKCLKECAALKFFFYWHSKGPHCSVTWVMTFDITF